MKPPKCSPNFFLFLRDNYLTLLYSSALFIIPLLTFLFTYTCYLLTDRESLYRASCRLNRWNIRRIRWATTRFPSGPTSSDGRLPCPRCPSFPSSPSTKSAPNEDHGYRSALNEDEGKGGYI